MKRIAIAALALSLLGATAASAAPFDRYGHSRYDTRGDYNRFDRDGRFDRDRFDNHRGFQRNHWRRGDRFHHRGPVFQVRDYHRYNLRRPPRGHHWVRVGNDYILVAITTGIIANVLLNHR